MSPDKSGTAGNKYFLHMRFYSPQKNGSLFKDTFLWWTVHGRRVTVAESYASHGRSLSDYNPRLHQPQETLCVYLGIRETGL